MMHSTAAVHATSCSERQRLAKIIAQQKDEAASARLVRSLASALLQLLNIAPQGNALVAWLGDNGCRCNADAVRAWIKVQLEDPELAWPTSNPQLLVEALMHRLQHHLFVIEDGLA